MEIGFIGFGEAAYNICIGLKQQGINSIVAYDAQANSETIGKLVHSRAEEAGVTLYDSPEEVVEYADIFFVAVPSEHDVEVCKMLKKSLKKGEIYVDVSASSPDSKVEIWELIKDKGVLFADAAMLGSLPINKHRVPITASGNGAKAFYDAMTPLGMSITCIDGKAGLASAIKLIRSIFTKGLSTLMLEVLQCADAYDVVDEVVLSLSKSMDSMTFEKQLNNLVIGSCIHAKRRSHELAGSIQLLNNRELDDAMTTASKHKLDLLANYKFNEYYSGTRPSDFKEIIKLMKKN